MKKGTLEVLLVHAQGITRTNLVGKPSYYVITQCGNKIYKSKISKGKNKTWWNQKFRFEFPLIDWKDLTHVKFRVMDKEIFTDGGFVGETIIYIGGIISEGIDKGLVEVIPTPYNVVLEDDTYKGAIKIGLNFKITNVNKEEQKDKREFGAPLNGAKHSFCKIIINILKSSWLRFRKFL